jgi:hypothetical protein
MLASFMHLFTYDLPTNCTVTKRDNLFSAYQYAWTPTHSSISLNIDEWGDALVG